MAAVPPKLKHARLPLGLPRAVRPRSVSDFAGIRMRATRPLQRAQAAAPEAPESAAPAPATER